MYAVALERSFKLPTLFSFNGGPAAIITTKPIFVDCFNNLIFDFQILL